jgi:ribosomal protein L3 glutamine methyltransferase
VTLRARIAEIADRFERAHLFFGHGTDNALDEAAWLVGHVARIAPEKLARHLDKPLTAAQDRRAQALAAQRMRTRRPLAYLLREAWFAGLRFFVDARVIVPRSLTAEFILERFAPWIAAGRVRRILDLCTGSGCMAIACARAFPRARVDAVDLSPAALAVARVNVRRHGLGGRVRLIRSDLFARLGQARYDVIITNPPYVDARDLAEMPAEYRREPRLALAAGDDGLAVVVRILREAAAHLEPGGILVGEVGNSLAALQARYPNVPFVWLSTSSGDESVFLLTAEALRAHSASFRA